MTTPEAYEHNHRHDKKSSPAESIALFGAMCAIFGVKFTVWFYIVGILLLIGLWCNA